MLLLVLALLALLYAFFDWNWFRPLLERHLTESSQRAVHVGDLRVSLDPDLRPVVHLKAIDIENASWADARPFLRAGEASATFSWQSLVDGPPVVTLLMLKDAEIDLERQADGLRNWRLLHPDDRGPPRIFVRTIEAHNSRLRFIDRGMQLDIELAATPLPQPDEHYSQRVSFSGRYEGTAFTGQADTGPVLSLRDSNQYFALRGQARSGESRVEIEGSAADVLKLGGADATIHLAGPSLAQLHPFLSVKLPATRPFHAEGQLKKDGEAIDIEALKIKLGDSDLTGEFHYDENSSRPTVRTRLRSDVLSLADIGLAGSAASSPSQRLIPAEKLPAELLASTDAQIDLAVRRFKLPGLNAPSTVRFTAGLDHGMLDVSPLEADIAGGRLSGRISLDSREQPASGQIELKLHNAKLAALIDDLPKKEDKLKGELDGPLQGSLKLSGRGDSLATLLGSADGTLLLSLEGGQIASGLDAKLGLNGGKLLRHFLRGDEPVPIRCGALAMDFRHGVGTTRRLVLDTAQTHVEGGGHVGLDDEQFEFLLTPQPQQTAALALNSSIRVRGGVHHGVDVSLAERSTQPMTPGCAVGRKNPA